MTNLSYFKSFHYFIIAGIIEGRVQRIKWKGIDAIDVYVEIDFGIINNHKLFQNN